MIVITWIYNQNCIHQTYLPVSSPHYPSHLPTPKYCIITKYHIQIMSEITNSHQHFPSNLYLHEVDYETKKFNEIINIISKYSRYQYILVTFIALYSILISYCAMIGSFVFMNPVFQCQSGLETERNACQHLQDCKITNDFTAAVKNQLYCGQQDLRSSIQSIYAIGSAIGMVFTPFLTDIIGRKKSLILAFLSGVAGTSILYVGIKDNIDVLMMVGMTICGFFGASLLILSFIITCDMCCQKIRQKALIAYYGMWGVAEMTFYLLYFYKPQWEFYVIYVLLAPSIVLLVFFCIFTIQSPVYAIFCQRDLAMFKKILKKLKFYNKIQQSQCSQAVKRALQIIDFLASKKQKQLAIKEALRRIFSNKRNLRYCICLCLILSSMNFFYYGMQFSMERTGFNFGLSMLIIGANQFVAYISGAFVTKYTKRRVGTIVSMSVSIAVGLLFLIQFGEMENIVQTVFAVLARISSVYVYCYFILLQSQLIEIQIRPTAVAFINGIAQGVRILLPYIVNLANNLQIHIIIVSAVVLGIFGFIPAWVLDQSYKQDDKPKPVSQKTKVTRHQLLTQYQ